MAGRETQRLNAYPWLFRGTPGRILARVAPLLSSPVLRRRRTLHIAGLVVITAIAVALGSHMFSDMRRTEWTRAVQRETEQADAIEMRIQLQRQVAGELPASPVGAQIHGQHAMAYLDQAQRELGALREWAGAGVSEREAYDRLGSISLHRALKLDAPDLQLAREAVRAAGSEIDLANHVAAISQTWLSTGVPVNLPSRFVPVWMEHMTALESSLESGNVNAINATVRDLALLKRAGAIESEVAAITSKLGPGGIAAMAQPISAVDVALAHVRTDAVNHALHTLRALTSRMELDYALRVIDLPGEPTAVIRHNTAIAGSPDACFVLVGVFGSNGMPMAVPVFDTELKQWRTVHTYGVQISAGLYDQFRSDKIDHHLPIAAGSKTPDELYATYDFPVLNGRITHW
ncbi:hypothetical protein B1A_03407 [mine drainage metagenome]|uniref:Uncharacterized protein n=1 Tax=mine drainage metagenome TaxID=410659 RepID=T1C5Y6_9ZZZZ